jgi:hypothetical protein
MSVLSAVYVLALILGSAILLIAAVFGAIVVHAYFDRRPGYSYFAGGVTALRARDDNNHSCG